MHRHRSKPAIPFQSDGYKVPADALTEKILARELDFRLALNSHVSAEHLPKLVDDLLKAPIGPHHNTPVETWTAAGSVDEDTVHPLTWLDVEHLAALRQLRMQESKGSGTDRRESIFGWTANNEPMDWSSGYFKVDLRQDAPKLVKDFERLIARMQASLDEGSRIPSPTEAQRPGTVERRQLLASIDIDLWSLASGVRISKARHEELLAGVSDVPDAPREKLLRRIDGLKSRFFCRAGIEILSQSVD